MTQHAGPTGKFPLGKLTQDDGGELAIRVGVVNSSNTILLDFGTKVAWVGLDLKNAEALISVLTEKVAILRARLSEKGKTKNDRG